MSISKNDGNGSAIPAGMKPVLIRIWHWDNQTKRWTFFDPRPAFADANTMKGPFAGGIYWVRVGETAKVKLPSGTIELFEGWNLIVW